VCSILRIVPQLSLFSAGTRPYGVRDLAGLLCGPGRIARFGAGDQARLSVVPLDAGRVPAVVAACTATGIPVRPVTSATGEVTVRSAFRCDLVGLAADWLTDGPAGAVKTVPPGWQLDGAALRLWALATGRPDDRGGYLLLLDTHAPQTHQPLVAAMTRLGIPPARVAGGTALRISGTRRVQRLVELVGPAPVGVPDGDWPRHWGRRAG